jgi:cell division protein FtsB
MQDQMFQNRGDGAGARQQNAAPPSQFLYRAVALAVRMWRPAGSGLAVVLALLLGWHVVNGRHGLSMWQQKRLEDQRLRKEIDSLQQENAQLCDRVQKLKSDPDAIEHEAREKLHYAKPGEVIYDLPEAAKPQSAPTPALR